MTPAGTAALVRLVVRRDRVRLTVWVVSIVALVAVSASCLTLYDMLKSIDRAMVIDDVKLLEKDGGRSGHFVRERA